MSKMRVRVQIRACPSCRQTHSAFCFEHVCPDGPWLTAALCDDCGELIDGEAFHWCDFDVAAKFPALFGPRR